LLIKYIRSVLWRIAKRLEDARCLKVKKFPFIQVTQKQSKAKPLQQSSRSVKDNKQTSWYFTKPRRGKELPSTVAASIASRTNSIFRRHSTHKLLTLNFCYKNIFFLIYISTCYHKEKVCIFSPMANALSCLYHKVEVMINGTG